MNAVTEFQKRHGSNVRNFLASEDGRAFAHILASLRPKTGTQLLEHQIVQSYGEIAGYEKALTNMFAVCSELVEVKQPEANYGVKPPQDVS